VVLSFEIELQVPAASIILSIFLFKDRRINLAKAMLLVLSFVVLIYYYWSSMLASYTVVIWWINIIIVLLWVWLLFTGSNKIDYGYYDIYGGQPKPESENVEYINLNDIPEFDNMSEY